MGKVEIVGKVELWEVSGNVESGRIVIEKKEISNLSKSRGNRRNWVRIEKEMQN